MNSESRRKSKSPTVGIVLIVVRDNKLLIGMRREEHGFGKLSVPGGHLEFGESIEACALRELKEETGMTAKRKDVSVITLSNQPVPGAHYVNIGVLIKNPVGTPQETAPEEHGDWQWVNWDTLSKLDVYDMVLPTIRKYQQGKFY
ncbi:NUDIX domain-containing protein [Candidatus Gottesmanbacteria bacterium]|nr:NUDIX domain-containing protein [Candidatus Gottesmanbacteria bacterium]